MVSYNEYLKNILEKIIFSYHTLMTLMDEPGDLEIIKREILKINGLFHVLIKKIDSEKLNSLDLMNLKSKIDFYLKNYSFEKEIETMSLLYFNDSNRLKNIRLKILESLEDKRLINNIEQIIEKL